TAFAITACATTITARLLTSFALAKLAHVRAFTREVVLAGEGNEIGQVLDYMGSRKPPFVSIRGVFVDDRANHTVPLEPYGVLGTPDALTDYVRLHCNTVDDVIIALPWSGDDRLLPLVNRLRELAVNVYLASDLAGF